MGGGKGAGERVPDRVRLRGQCNPLQRRVEPPPDSRSEEVPSGSARSGNAGSAASGGGSAGEGRQSNADPAGWNLGERLPGNRRVQLAGGRPRDGLQQRSGTPVSSVRGSSSR